LFQAILNIAKNALEAVTESNTPSPWVRFSTRAVRRAHPGSKGAHTMLRVRIEDNGPGIPDDLKDRIFFPMVSGRAQGSGIGLSITQTIISRHHGWIEVESEPGHTAIDVILPFGDTP
jgi:two-component system nitrogen regulation sensor histidine kinase GlnL